MNDILNKNLNNLLKLSNHIKNQFGVDTTYDNVVDKAIEIMEGQEFEIKPRSALPDNHHPEWFSISADDSDRNGFGSESYYARKIR